MNQIFAHEKSGFISLQLNVELVPFSFNLSAIIRNVFLVKKASVAHFWPQNNNEKRGFTASQEIGQTTFVLKKRQYKEIERLL